MQLTPHFHLSEFTRSSTAERKHIINQPPVRVIANLQQLCQQVLEPLRVHINEMSPSVGGQRGLLITSGYRCPLLNKAVGGSSTSQHMTGEAADIHIPDIPTGREWFTWIMNNLHFDQLIWEGSKSTHWIHVSFRSDPSRNRQQVLQIRMN